MEGRNDLLQENCTLSPLLQIREAAELLGVDTADAWYRLQGYPGAVAVRGQGMLGSYLRRSVVSRVADYRKTTGQWPSDGDASFRSDLIMLADRVALLENTLEKMQRSRDRRKPISPEQRKRIIARDGNNCVYCGKRVKTTLVLDHRIPVSRGGSNDDENLSVCCRECNVEKGTKTDDEYLASPIRRGTYLKFQR